MAYLHCRTRIRIQNPIITLYYAEIFTLVQIQISTRIVSQMVTVPVLRTDLCAKDRYLSPITYISIRGSESESKPMEKILPSIRVHLRVGIRVRIRQCK